MVRDRTRKPLEALLDIQYLRPMNHDQTTRRLSAILAADVVGYSRMMAADEVGALAALKRHRETIFDPAIARHKGRLVKLIGDGTLVEFSSVVDAVRCAVDVQSQTGADNPDGDRIVLRIGINLGDVIVEGDDIYGDGVNIAARLEALAAPGGVCISSIVQESVASRIEATFIDGGGVTVKNIDRPIRVWHWPSAGGSSTKGGQTVEAASPAPEHAEGASIAVLAFANMSGDPEQEYFSDGISEDIITDLSKIKGLAVIARNSSFAYKGKSVDLRQVGRELGVTSILEGSIRRAGNRVRITAQLIDTDKGVHLWAERFDRDLTDIFAVQDEVTRQIVDALELTLGSAGAKAPTVGSGTDVGAHDLFLRARALLFGQTKTRQTFEQTVSLLRQSIDLDPDYSQAHAAMAHAHTLDFQNQWTGSDEALSMAGHFADRALEADPKEPYAHYSAALVAIWERDLQRAKHESEVALSLNPSYAAAYGIRGIVEIYFGNPLAGIPHIERAMRLDPMFAQQNLHFMGCAYLLAGRFEVAAASLRERIRLVPDTDLSRAMLASTLGHLGEVEEARQVWADLMRVNPDYVFERHLGRLPFVNKADSDRIAQGLAKADLP